jgi:hypothetical protein
VNRSICRGCRRFAECKEPSDDRWLCARSVSYGTSHVIPGHRILIRDQFSPITIGRSTPPQWCEFAAEQVVIGSSEVVDVDAFPESELIPDREQWRNSL